MRMQHFSDVSEDPQAWANDYLEYVTSPSGNTNVMPRSPIEMDSGGLTVTQVAHGIGADTDEVLANIGYTPEQIVAMRQSGAVK